MQFDSTRRLFLGRFTKGAAAVTILGIAACTDAAEPTNVVSPTTSIPPTTAPGTTPESTTTRAPESTTLPGTEGAGGWHRVNLGFVSAYVIVRNGEIAVIDTGTSGSAADIEAVIAGTGRSWSDVGHIIATHSHGDHVGSLSAVMNAAPDATAYAGAGDIPDIDAPRELQAVGDGDQVFGLDVIATPGHTPGHICLLDTGLSLLLAGDAINGAAGGVAGPNPQFTPDMTTALESVAKLGGFEFEAVGFGHGDPVLMNGAQLVRDLATG